MCGEIGGNQRQASGETVYNCESCRTGHQKHISHLIKQGAFTAELRSKIVDPRFRSDGLFEPRTIRSVPHDDKVEIVATLPHQSSCVEQQGYFLDFAEQSAIEANLASVTSGECHLRLQDF